MPTNLPPEYYQVEERYKAAGSPEEQISLLEELISTIPKHKGTDHLRADLRRKLSKMKAAAQQRKGAVRQVSPFHIDKEGAGQVALVGMTNVGKSALIRALTNATPEVADYPYTTWTPTPGMMEVGYVQIQLIDTPPLSKDYVDPEFLNLIRRADLILLVINLQSDPLGQFEDALAILEENRILPEQRRTEFEDQRRLMFKPLLVVVTGADDESLDEEFAVLCELLGENCSLLPVSAVTDRNLDGLRWAVFQRLGIMRVYARPPGKEPDFTAPFVLKVGDTVKDFAGQVHKDFLEKLQSARIWGEGVFDGQMVGRDHILHDGDVVELRI